MAGFDTVSFLSDYGTSDEFVGLVKAVIRDLAPHATVIDLTHDIPPHDIRAGSLALARCIQYVPAGVVMAVVDPGVGTARRAVAVEVAGGAGVVVAPDNGLIAPAVAMAGGPGRAVELDRPRVPPGLSRRHLRGPGRLRPGHRPPLQRRVAGGLRAQRSNRPPWCPGSIPVPREERGALVAEVLWVDRFGNAQLNVGPEDLSGWGEVVRLTWGDNVRTARLSSPPSTRSGRGRSAWCSIPTG